jgi:hypothetical protein
MMIIIGIISSWSAHKRHDDNNWNYIMCMVSWSALKVHDGYNWETCMYSTWSLGPHSNNKLTILNSFFVYYFIVVHGLMVCTKKT